MYRFPQLVNASSEQVPMPPPLAGCPPWVLVSMFQPVSSHCSCVLHLVTNTVGAVGQHHCSHCYRIPYTQLCARLRGLIKRQCCILCCVLWFLTVHEKICLLLQLLLMCEMCGYPGFVSQSSVGNAYWCTYYPGGFHLCLIFCPCVTVSRLFISLLAASQ